MHKLAAPPMPAWLEAMVPYQRYCVDVGRRMHVMEIGRGLPVLLLHGNPSWGFLYRRVVAALTGATGGPPLRLIMPDLIGLGFSEKPRDEAAHQLDNHIGWMARFIDLLGIERCVMAIQDWGGAIGVGALAELDLPAGLVVMNTVVTPPKRSFAPTPVHRLSRLPWVSDVLFRRLGLAARGMRLVQGDRSSIRGEVARGYLHPLRRYADNLGPLALLRMVPNDHQHPSIPALERCARWVEQFDGPAAIVWGDRDPVLGSVRGWIEKRFPQAPVTRTNAGHFLQEEVPDEIAAAIRSVAGQLTA